MPEFKYAGKRFLACGESCAESFRTDRRYGAIYGPYLRDDGTFIQCAEDASVEWGMCVYCNREIPNVHACIWHDGTTWRIRMLNRTASGFLSKWDAREWARKHCGAETFDFLDGAKDPKLGSVS